MTRFKALLMLLSLICVTGCGTRHVYQEPGTATLLRKPIIGAEVDGPDKDGNLIPGIADIPRGAVIVVPKDNIRKDVQP